MLQRQLNQEHPGGGAGDGPAAPGGAAAKGKSALASVRPGQLRAGVASKRALLRFMGKRGPLPASLVGKATSPAAGGGAGGGGGARAEGGGGGAAGDGGGDPSDPREEEGGGGGDGPGDLFQFYRLLLPSLDDERGRYHLKETLLARALCRAAGRDPATDPGAARVLAWQRDGSGTSAGSLAHVARDELVSARERETESFFFFLVFARGRERKREARKNNLFFLSPSLFSKKKKNSISSPTAATSRASPPSRSAGWASSTAASTVR